MERETPPFWIDAGSGGPGGWNCHTFPDGSTFSLICLADDCPDRDKRNPDRFRGELLVPPAVPAVSDGAAPPAAEEE